MSEASIQWRACTHASPLCPRKDDPLFALFSGYNSFSVKCNGKMIWENEYIINYSYVRLQKRCFFLNMVYNVIADTYEHGPPPCVEIDVSGSEESTAGFAGKFTGPRTFNLFLRLVEPLDRSSFL